MSHGWDSVGGQHDKRSDDRRVAELERRVAELEKIVTGARAIWQAAAIVGAIIAALWAAGTWIWDKVHR